MSPSVVTTIVADIAKIAVPAACAQAVQLVLMIYLSRSAGTLGLASLAANGLSEILIVVTSIQPLIAFGLGLSAVVSQLIGSGDHAAASASAVTHDRNNSGYRAVSRGVGGDGEGRYAEDEQGGNNNINNKAVPQPSGKGVVVGSSDVRARRTTLQQQQQHDRKAGGGGQPPAISSSSVSPSCWEDDFTGGVGHNFVETQQQHQRAHAPQKYNGDDDNNNKNNKRLLSESTSTTTAVHISSASSMEEEVEEEEEKKIAASYRWQNCNPEAVWSFWSASALTVGFALFVCTPLALFVGPSLLRLCGVSPELVALVYHQLLLLAVYPVLFAIYFCLAQLCVIEKRTDILVWASVPVLAVSVPFLTLYFSSSSSSSSSSRTEETLSNHHQRHREGSSGLTALALVWLFAMVIELALIIFMAVRAGIIPPFGQVVDSGTHLRLPKVFKVPWSNYLSRLLKNEKTWKILVNWLLPSLGVFVAGHTAFELGFVIGGGGGGGTSSNTVVAQGRGHHHASDVAAGSHGGLSASLSSTSSVSVSSSSSCAAATLVVAHQVRFAMTLIPQGIVTALNALFSKHLGAKKLYHAQTALVACIVSALFVTIAEGALLVLAQEYVPSFFHTDDNCVKKEFSKIVWPMAAALVCEFVVWNCVTVLRCVGYRTRALVVTLGAWWVLTLPSIAFFAWEQKRGAASVFDGAAIGQCLMTAPALYFCHRAWMHVFKTSSNSSGGKAMMVTKGNRKRNKEPRSISAAKLVRRGKRSDGSSSSDDDDDDVYDDHRRPQGTSWL